MLPELKVPDSITYVGAFITMSCGLRCKYCINFQESQGGTNRAKVFPMTTKKSHVGLTPDKWVIALNRLPKNISVPITLCGGEPSIYWGGEGCKTIINNTDHYFDVLTNLGSLKMFDGVADISKLQRPAPFPSIRVSWHEDEMNRVWSNDGFNELVRRCQELRKFGFDVTDDPKTSDVIIQMVEFPTNIAPHKSLWEGKVAFETKDFLGVYEGKLYGEYAYKHSTDLISNGYYDRPLECLCSTGELLISEQGFIFSCHKFLYDYFLNQNKNKEFASMLMHDFKFNEYKDEFFNYYGAPIGHILDESLDLTIISTPKKCYSYGECVGCDTKLKRARFIEGQEYTGLKTFSSVKITNIQWPAELQVDLT